MKTETNRELTKAQKNNLLRWHNPDFIVPYDKENPPKLKTFDKQLTSEDIDRTYGNKPYFFYNSYGSA